MRWDEWRFSAALAWRDIFVRSITGISFVLAGSISGYAIWRLVPEGMRSGVLALHYTMYLGIDDVRAWPWIFALPGSIFSLLLVNAVVSAGIYRTDVFAARVLSTLSCALTIVWSVGMFFLVRINL